MPIVSIPDILLRGLMRKKDQSSLNRFLINRSLKTTKIQLATRLIRRFTPLNRNKGSRYCRYFVLLL